MSPLDIVTHCVTLILILKIDKLIWDAWNISHITRHDVVQNEVEEVCHNGPIVEQGKKGRLLVIGFTLRQRLLTIILDSKDQEGIYYPVTARMASRKERKIYENEKLGGENK